MAVRRALAICILSTSLSGCVDLDVHGHIPPDGGQEGSRAPEPGLTSWPTDGMVGVPDELTGVDLALPLAEPPERLHTAWRGPTGPVMHETRALPCDLMGTEGSACVRLIPLRRLSHGVHEVGIDEGSLDAERQPITPIFARFEVSGLAPPTSELAPFECHVDELEIADLCVLVSDVSVDVRASLTGPGRISLRLGNLDPLTNAWSPAGSPSHAIAPLGAAEVSASRLNPNRPYRLELSVESLDGTRRVAYSEIRTHPALPEWAIAEVLADPIGADPDQEYVELVNDGEGFLPLHGLQIADDPYKRGDTISASYQVAPGGRVLLVGSNYDPTAGGPIEGAVIGGVSPPPGVPLVRLEGPIATGGITNDGEALFLRDAEGRRLSATPRLDAGEGRCLLRRGENGRSGDAGDFEAGVECTPGRPSSTDSW